MVLYDPHRRWGPRGICRWEDRGIFFAEGGQVNRKPSAVVQVLWDQAKEICAMCPVRRECERDSLGEEYGVFGGRDQYERYRIRKLMSQALWHWPEQRRLAWAKEIYTLREAGMYWSKIQTQTGLPQSAAEQLFRIWQEHLKTQPKAAAKVVDLELPEPQEKRPFPEKHGRRDAWVRHRGVVSDAWYRGQTGDGRWIAVTTEAGRGQVHKWCPAEDVHLYRPQAVVILNYRARPDEAA